MAHPGKGLLVCLGVVAGCFTVGYALLRTASLLTKGRPAAPSVPPAASPPLRSFKIYDLKLKGQTTGSLSAGENHRYLFHLVEGQFLEAKVEQDPVPRQEVDVRIRLFAPVGGKIFEIDSPTENVGAEEIHLLAERTGWYQAEVDSNNQPGAYRIDVRSVRTARPRDRDLFRAEELFYHAREIDDRNCQQAIPEFLQAEDMGKPLGRVRLRAEALMLAGDCFFKLGQPKEALTRRTAALDLYQRLGDTRKQTVLLNRMGQTYDQLADVEGMERSCRQALALSQETRDPGEEAAALLQLSRVLKRKGQTWSAIAACEKALEYWERVQNWNQAVIASIDLGMMYVSTGEYQRALDLYQRAEGLIPIGKGEGLRAWVFSRTSEVLQITGDLEQARASAIQAVILHKKAGDRLGMGAGFSSLGLIFQKSRNLRQAREYHRQALKIYRSISYHQGMAIAYINLGLLSLEEGQAYEALGAFQQGFGMVRRLKFRDGEAVALSGLAHAERMRGNPIQARTLAFEMLNLVESIRKEAVRDDFKSHFLATKQNSYDLLLDLLVRSPASATPPADIALSFGISERRRARSLLESLTFSGRWAVIEKNADLQSLAEYRLVSDKIDELDRERRRRQRRGLRTDDEERALRGLIDRLRSLIARIQETDEWQSGSNRGEPVTLTETQKLLDSDTILLEYFLGSKRSLVWLVSHETAEVFVLPPRKEIEAQARKLYYLLRESQSRSGGEHALEAARALGEMVLGPVARRFGKKRLVIVPDGALHYVPFAVFPDVAETLPRSGAGKQPLLIESHEIVNLPSASVLQELRTMKAHRAPPPGLLAMVMNPVFASSVYAPLTQSAREAEVILEQVPPGAKTLVLEGVSASRDAVMDGRLAQFRIVHFSTHGEIDTDIPELSGVVLSRKGDKDEYLRFQDIQRLALPVDLVVLSACNTARGKELRGEGLVGLTQSFMHAGASAVMVSLWNVNEDSTPVFMKHFYHAIFTDNASPSAALRAAQVAMIRDKIGAHPITGRSSSFKGIGGWKAPREYAGPWPPSAKQTLLGRVFWKRTPQEPETPGRRDRPRRALEKKPACTNE